MPHLRRLQDRSGETVKLGALSSGQVLVLAAVESTQQLHTRGDVGRRWALHSSGLGKAILSQLDDVEIDLIVTQHGLPRLTPRTLNSRAQLGVALAEIRAAGYARDWEENEPGVRMSIAMGAGGELDEIALILGVEHQLDAAAREQLRARRHVIFAEHEEESSRGWMMYFAIQDVIAEPAMVEVRR